MLKLNIFIVVTLSLCANQYAVAQQKTVISKSVEITSRLSAQKDVAKPHEIIDNTFIVVGGEKPRASVYREQTNTTPVYHFQASGNANRIEFTTCFGTEENLKNFTIKEIEDLKAVKDAYINSEQGEYGQTITYEWSTLFPEAMTENGGGIFAQWHGRPDRTLVKTPEGKLKKLEIKDFVNLLELMYFDKNIGKDKVTHEPNGWLVEQSAGGPIAAFHFKPDYMYLMVRSEANRQSDPTIKVKPKPGKHLNKVIGKDGKTGSIAFEMPTDQVPINTWINFKARIKYSKYSATSDEVLESGGLELWMNGEKVANWKGNIGKNDELGPYFKFGIYKPGKDGFKVNCKDFKQTIKE